VTEIIKIVEQLWSPRSGSFKPEQLPEPTLKVRIDKAGLINQGDKDSFAISQEEVCHQTLFQPMP